MTASRTIAAFCILCSTLAACTVTFNKGSTPGRPTCENAWEPPPGTPAVRVHMVEFEIRGIPERLPPGLGSFCVQNDGTVPHDLRLSPIPEGMTLEEVVTRKISPRDLPLAFLGASAEPGHFTTFGHQLDPVPHAYACFLETPDGTTHASLGMRGGFTVL